MLRLRTTMIILCVLCPLLRAPARAETNVALASDGGTDRILWTMIATYAEGGFQNGVGKGGEWTRWDGTRSGYEGMLTDAYTTQTVLFSGYYGIAFTPDGFRLEPWSPLKGKRTSLGLAYMGKPAASVK